MPMPPPKASIQLPRDRHFQYEIGQIVRALQENGEQSAEDLSDFVGAGHWELGTFECALRAAVRNGLITRTADGTLTAT